jgi:LPXTG-motif cell wall-anchored protein
VERRGIKMMKDGAPAQFSDFHSGDRLSATIVTTHPPKVMTQQQVNATLAKAAPASGASGTAASRSSSGSAAPVASKSTSGSAATPAGGAKKLPKTASEWPLLALASILSIATGLMLTVRRRVLR